MEPHTPSCAPQLSPGVCKSQEPTRGTAGLEHLPAPAWLALRSKCGAAEHREPWLSQYQLSGAVAAEPPKVGGIALIFEGQGVRWPAGWGQVWDPLPRSLMLHSRGLGWTSGRWRTWHYPEEPDLQYLSLHTVEERDFPEAQDDSTQLREGQHRLWGPLLDLTMSLKMLSLTLEGCGRGDPIGQGQSECCSL